MNKLTTLAVLCVTLTACSTARTTIYPEGVNSFASVTNAASESDAHKDALKKADATCAVRGKYLRVVSNKVHYQGPDAQTKAMETIANGVISAMNSNTAVVGTSSTNDDYRVTLKFRCVGHHPIAKKKP